MGWWREREVTLLAVHLSTEAGERRYPVEGLKKIRGITKSKVCSFQITLTFALEGQICRPVFTPGEGDLKGRPRKTTCNARVLRGNMEEMKKC
jgi:hypothetical protein